MRPRAIATTRMELIDCEPLRDEDRLTAGFYVACEGINADYRIWRGAVVYRSLDGGKTYRERLAIVRRAAITGVVVEEGVDTCVVRLLNDNVLVSVGDEEVRDGNANLAVIGSGVVQFLTATLISHATYRLTGFVTDASGPTRGEVQFTAKRGERFVLATDALVRVAMDSFMLDREYTYMATTINKVYGIAKRFTCRAKWR